MSFMGKIHNSLSPGLSTPHFVCNVYELLCVLLLSRIILGDCQGATSLGDIPWRYESVPMECIHVIQANCFSSMHCLNWDAGNIKHLKLVWHLLWSEINLTFSFRLYTGTLPPILKVKMFLTRSLICNIPV